MNIYVMIRTPTYISNLSTGKCVHHVVFIIICLYKMRHARVVVGQPDLRRGVGEGRLRRGNQDVAAGADVRGATPHSALNGAQDRDRQVADAIQELYKGILTWENWWIRIYLYDCMYRYICIYIHIWCIHVCVYIYIYTCVCMCKHINVYIYIYIHTCAYRYKAMHSVVLM